MIIQRIEGATRTLGAPADNPEVRPLAVRDMVLEDGSRCVVSAWEPTADELARLNAGHPVYLYIFGTNMPPAFVGVK